MQTKLTKILNTKYPIIQAPMFLVSNVAMVTEAMKGGIAGCIPALNYRTLDELRSAIKELKANKVSSLLTMASEEKSGSTVEKTTSKTDDLDLITENINKIGRTVESVLNEKTYTELSKMRILWVDDKPEKNLYMRQVLQELSIDVTMAISITEAIGLVKNNNYDMIISDYWRPNDQDAGYNLLKKLQENYDFFPPYVFYTKTNELEKRRREAKEKGAFDCTNDPSELLNIIKEIKNKR